MRWAFAACLFLFGCSSNSIPAGILPPDKMKVIIFDLVRTDEYVANYLSADSVAAKTRKRMQMYTDVFALHQTNNEVFYKSYQYYTAHPDQQKRVFDSLAVWAPRLLDVPVVRPVSDSLIH